VAKICVSLLTAADGGPASAELVDVFRRRRPRFARKPK
jgi:hypothetical protein